ncbi:hypothetical protein [Desulfobulbus elongatus]|uniref:hypothetical protein n=1 Tax=Desulfobulbus elongatus TaxID=53332 RepID=UPI000480B75E|nr:hypothetical protein [Desulfobulbus elongatus]
MTERKTPAPPQISPYIFPALLAGFGLWCVYDGWFTTDPEMLKHQLFNRIAGGVLLVWAIIDFIRTRKREKAEQVAKDTEPPAN